ncbi:MAG TPA: zinc-dependent metalloprotease [Acidimicrobiia bacterium]|nr:zinc-dependent metalloprotease [Acidimicrobiia bacterium]
MTDSPQPDEPDEGESGRGGATGPGAGLPGLPFGPGAAASFDLGQLMRMLQSEGPVNWEVARQVAAWVALEGAGEQPVDAADREQFDELARAAQTHVVAETGLTATFRAPLRAVGPKEWSDLHLDALRPVLEALAANLGEVMRSAGPTEIEGEPGPGGAAAAGPFGADPFGGLLGMLAPLLLGLQAGSMIGYLAQHALGRYDLPLPTSDEPSLCFVVPNVVAFEEAWSLPRADLRFYLALHEVVHAAERSVPWVRERLVRLTTEYVSAYELDTAAFESKFGDIDPSDPTSLGGIAEDPEALLGAMRSPRQGEMLAQLQSLTSVLEGYADSVLERIGARLIPSFAQIHEAMKRHRLERGEAERFVQRLLGLALEREHYERGEAFCAGVVERAGVDGLNRLWEQERMLPTSAEVEAPGLWLARIELPD